jgi:hypothetical protein
MLALRPETVRLVEMIAVTFMLPWLGFIAVALLMRQLRRWGFNRGWGEE